MVLHRRVSIKREGDDPVAVACAFLPVLPAVPSCSVATSGPLSSTRPIGLIRRYSLLGVAGNRAQTPWGCRSGCGPLASSSTVHCCDCTRFAILMIALIHRLPNTCVMEVITGTTS